LLTYLIYCGLVFVAPPQVAYAIVYALGVVLAYAGHVRWVFRARPRVATAAIYPLLYLLQYSLTAGLLELLLRHWRLGERLALAVAIVIVTPLSFLLSRRVLQRDRDESRVTNHESSP
jgi:putative flippase GtrA